MKSKFEFEAVAVTNLIPGSRQLTLALGGVVTNIMILYKYLGRKDFFSNLKLRFTQPNELNDPRECVPELKFRDPRGYINAVIQRNFESGYLKLLSENPNMTPQHALTACIKASSTLENDYIENHEEWVKRVFDKFMEVTNRDIGVLSLTESNNNELMWAHYADSHNGYVIGFESEHSFFKPTNSDPKSCGELMNVVYGDISPVVYIETGSFSIPKEVFFTKTERWSDEREWRIIKMLEHANEQINESIYLFEVPSDAIKEVIFGCKVTSKAREEIESNFQELVPHVTFRQASYNHKSEFKIT